MATKRKTPEIDPKVQKRVLRFFNAARTPEDLLEVPQNEIEVFVDPEHRRKTPERHEPIERQPPDQLFDLEQAKYVLSERKKLSPLYGFTRLEQLEKILGDDFRRLIELLLKWFSGLTYGEWSEPIPLADEDGPFSVVHAAVVHTGDVLMIEHACHPGLSKTPLWDPDTRTVKLPLPSPPTEGLYCSGHCFLSDGKLLVVGGRGDANHWYGYKNTAWLYDPDTQTWDYTRDNTAPTTPGPRTYMHHSRWYPTLVNLGDEPGRVLVASGDNTSNRTCNPPADPPSPMQMEIYSETTGKFDLVTTPADKYHRPTYPGLHPLPGGEIFFAPVGFKDSSETPGTCPGNEESAFFDFTGMTTGTWTDIGPNDRTKGMSVLLLSNTYPFVQVMTVGGGASATTETYRLINLSTLSPAWDPALPLPTDPDTPGVPTSRTHPNLVLLPDSTVFVCGGSPVGEPCWLYNPSTHSWSKMDELTYDRRYHSVAVLLPTGEVMATGGRHHAAGVETVEVFRPPYLFKGTQPVIDGVSPTPLVHHGRTFTIETKQSSEITKVVLVRPTAVTHQTDSEQRVIQLQFNRTSDDTLSATAPNGRHPHAMAPRGWYMLFILDIKGVPSKAKWFYLH